MIGDDGTTLPGSKVANTFGDFFAQKVSTLRERAIESDPELHQSESERTGNIGSKNSFWFKTVTPEEIAAIVSGLKNSNAVGSDGIPMTFVKKGISVLAFPIAWIINTSLKQGRFPSQWKEAITIPIHKKGKKEVKNFRPISNLCSTSKILEAVVKKQLEHFLERNGLLPRNQHGFRSNRSTTSAVTSLHSILAKARADRKAAGIACFDLTAAFDLVDHDILLRKMKDLGLSDGTLAWFQSFLSGRKQRIKWNNQISSQTWDLPVGTAQGGILSPLLFLIVTADLGKHLRETSLLAYADDSSIIAVGDSVKDVVHALERDAKNFLAYMSENMLIANPEKTQVMIVSTPQQHRLFSDGTLDTISIGGDSGAHFAVNNSSRRETVC